MSFLRQAPSPDGVSTAWWTADLAPHKPMVTDSATGSNPTCW
jgi:hypothetical protein